MLKRFEVTGFKNFKNKFVLDFTDVREYQFNTSCIRDGLLNNTVIYGKNAVGKTNFGLALFDISYNYTRMREFQNELGYLNADSDKPYAEFLYAFQFGKEEAEYTYRRMRTQKLTYEKLTVNGQIIFEYDYDLKTFIHQNLKLVNAETLNWSFIDDQISIMSYITNNIPLEKNHIIAKIFEYVKGMYMFRGNVAWSKTKSPEDIVNDIMDRGLVGDFEKFLNEGGVQEKLEETMLPTGEKLLCFKHQRLLPFIQNCSSGTLVLLRLYAACRMRDNILLLYVDEFDASYHYELSEKIIKMFAAMKCQTIVTTHNTSLLSNRIMRPDCFFIMTQDKLISLVNATDRELREGHNLEKLYRNGEFGE